MRFLRGFLFCLLSFAAFVLLGAYIAKLSGVAEGQGLAAGAIVLMYALMTGLLGILAAVFALKYAPVSLIKRINIGLACIALCLLASVCHRLRTGDGDGGENRRMTGVMNTKFSKTKSAAFLPALFFSFILVPVRLHTPE